jgi:hypothetical protein
MGWQWFRQASRPVQIGISISALLVTCCLCGGLGAALSNGSTTTSSSRAVNQATKTPKPTATLGPTATPNPTATPTPKPTATIQAVPYPPKTHADLRLLASLGNASAVHEISSENGGLAGVCPIPRKTVIVDPSITGRQFAEDILAYFYGQQIDSPCGSLVLAYHSKSEADDFYTAGRINFDATDSSGQENIDPNATNLKYTLTLDVGSLLSNYQEYVVNY